MRTSLKRWLITRGKPKQQPLYARLIWNDFAWRMHRAIDIDVRVLLGEVTLAELKRRQQTKPLPRVDPSAETLAGPRVWTYYDEETERAPRVLIDRYATDPMEKTRR